MHGARKEFDEADSEGKGKAEVAELETLSELKPLRVMEYESRLVFARMSVAEGRGATGAGPMALFM